MTRAGRPAQAALATLVALACSPGSDQRAPADAVPRPVAAEAEVIAAAEPEPRRSLDALLPSFDRASSAGTSLAELDLPPQPPAGVPFDAFEKEPPELVPPEPPELEAEPLTEYEGLPVRAEERRFAGGRLLSRRYVRRDPGTRRDVDHGPDRRWHPNGELAAWRTWIGGKLEGPALEWYENGVRMSARTYVSDVVDEVSVEYDPAGNPSKVQEWRRGTAHGGRWTWWARPRRPHTEELFEDGVAVGRHRKWSRGGLLIEDGRFEDGERHGPWTLWYENGIPRSTVTYEHGREQGRRLTWSASGKPIELDTFTGGVLDGLSVRWDPAGVKLRELRYEAGRPHGAARDWWPSGGPKSVVTYVDGTANGPTTYWFESGAKQIEGTMKDGARHGRWTYWRADGTVDPAWSGEYVDDVKVDAEHEAAPEGDRAAEPEPRSGGTGDAAGGADAGAGEGAGGGAAADGPGR